MHEDEFEAWLEIETTHHSKDFAFKLGYIAGLNSGVSCTDGFMYHQDETYEDFERDLKKMREESGGSDENKG
jgi:hypothetical protein